MKFSRVIEGTVSTILGVIVVSIFGAGVWLYMEVEKSAT